MQPEWLNSYGEGAMPEDRAPRRRLSNVMVIAGSLSEAVSSRRPRGFGLRPRPSTRNARHEPSDFNAMADLAKANTGSNQTRRRPSEIVNRNVPRMIANATRFDSMSVAQTELA